MCPRVSWQRTDDPPAGLTYAADFLSAAEERDLLSVVGSISYAEVVMRGQIAKRMVRHFGVDYDYDHREVVPTDPLPQSLHWLRDRCGDFAGVEPASLVECLVTRYPPDAGIGWHRDAPMFGGAVVGVSLGSSCTMRFRREAKGQRLLYEIELAPRSAYVMKGQARWAWQHSIPSTSELRFSLTFRTLRENAKRDRGT